MTKTEKKDQLKGMIKEFLEAKDMMSLTRLRNLIYVEIIQLPMSSNDRNTVEDAMYMWNYNSDRYISNTKNPTIKATLMGDFDAILNIVDNSLLKN